MTARGAHYNTCWTLVPQKKCSWRTLNIHNSRESMVIQTWSYLDTTGRYYGIIQRVSCYTTNFQILAAHFPLGTSRQDGGLLVPLTTNGDTALAHSSESGLFSPNPLSRSCPSFLVRFVYGQINGVTMTRPKSRRSARRPKPKIDPDFSYNDNDFSPVEEETQAE